MSTLYSTGRSGSDNPYTQVLSEEFLMNADRQEVKRTKARPTRPAIERFLEKTKVSLIHFYNGTPCLEWIGYIQPNGYGQFKADGRRGAKKTSPHRFAYEYYVGPIPEGAEPDHLCRVRHCCNWQHLEAVTHEENIRRATELITHCTKGHEFTEENTQIGPNGQRKCRQCNRDRQQAFHRANPGAQKRYRRNIK